MIFGGLIPGSSSPYCSLRLRISPMPTASVTLSINNRANINLIPIFVSSSTSLLSPRTLEATSYLVSYIWMHHKDLRVNTSKTKLMVMSPRSPN